MARVGRNTQSDLRILGQLYADNVSPVHLVHLSLIRPLEFTRISADGQSIGVGELVFTTSDHKHYRNTSLVSKTVQIDSDLSLNNDFSVVLDPFDTVEVYMTDAYKELSIEVDGSTNSYQATGNLIAFDTIQESADMQISKLGISLSGVDQTFVSSLLTYNYLDRDLEVHRVFLDDSEQILHEPLLVFKGSIDTPTITDDPFEGTSTVSIQAASAFVDFDRRNGRRTNTSEQDLYRSINSISYEDTGFEYAAPSETKFFWGRDVS